MDTATPFVSILPNLAIGVVAILALGFVVKLFVDYMQKREAAFEALLKERNAANDVQIAEREGALRTLEREIRTTITQQLSQNSQVMIRVVDYLNNH